MRCQTRQQEVLHRPLGLGVEGAERLVEQQHVGLGGQGPGDGDPLAHAARQLAGQAVGELARGRMIAEQLVDPLAPLRPSASLATSRPNAMLRGDGAPREQRVALEHHAAVGAGADDERRRRRAPRPRVGSSRPAMMVSSVDLPQPDAPSRHTSSPVVDVQVDVVERDDGRRRRGRNDLADAVDDELGGAVRSGRRVTAGPTGRRADAQPAQEQVADQPDHAEHDRAGRTSCRWRGTAAPARCGRPGPPGRRAARRRRASARRRRG